MTAPNPVVHLRHPASDEPMHDEATGEPITVTLLLGTDSIDRRRIEARARKFLRRDAVDAVGVLAVMTEGWCHLYENGAAIPCTVPNAVRIYTEHPWLREQVEERFALLAMGSPPGLFGDLVLAHRRNRR